MHGSLKQEQRHWSLQVKFKPEVGPLQNSCFSLVVNNIENYPNKVHF